MAVYKRGYQRYQGPLSAHWSRLFVLPRFAWQRLMQQRLVVILFVIAMFLPLGCAGFIYLANHAELLQGFGGKLANNLKVDAQFFVVFMNAQAFFAIVLSAFAGPSLIAPDLANGALPLYFSRPLSRPEYILARMLVLVGVLSPVTWIPGLLLFSMQSGMAGWTWFMENWRLGSGIFFGFLLWSFRVCHCSRCDGRPLVGHSPAEAPPSGGGFVTAPEVVFDEVSKFYGEVLGVNHVTLRIPSGITSLVGPNGSGKTTLMNLMAGLIFPDRGTITMRGLSPRDPERLMRITGYATQYDAAPRGATGFDFVSTGLLLAGYSKSEAAERAAKAIE